MEITSANGLQTLMLHCNSCISSIVYDQHSIHNFVHMPDLLCYISVLNAKRYVITKFVNCALFTVILPFGQTVSLFIKSYFNTYLFMVSKIT